MPIGFILLIGSILRFYNLGQIPWPVFDEVFYPVFAFNYLEGKNFFSVHPPLGSYLLSLGIYLYHLLPWTEVINFGITDIKDDIGDIIVILINIAIRKGITLEECMKVAYEDIKDRKGIMRDGIFIKEA